MKQKEEKKPLSDSTYGVFAPIYDRFTAHVPYKRWARYLCDHARRHFGEIPDRVLDLGCGTGTLLESLGLWVSELHGVDASAEMLEIAQGRLDAENLKQARIQDRLPFKSGSFPWITCSHDTLNYLVKMSELKRHFQEVARVLERGGLYSTEAVSLVNIMENHDGRQRTLRLAPYRIVIEREFNQADNLLTTALNFHNDPGGELQARETHLEKYYNSAEITAAAKSAGLRLLTREGNYIMGPPRRDDASMNFHFVKG